MIGSGIHFYTLPAVILAIIFRLSFNKSTLACVSSGHELLCTRLLLHTHTHTIGQSQIQSHICRTIKYDDSLDIPEFINGMTKKNQIWNTKKPKFKSQESFRLKCQRFGLCAILRPSRLCHKRERKKITKRNERLVVLDLFSN